MPEYLALLSSEELELLPSSSPGNLGRAGPAPILSERKAWLRVARRKVGPVIWQPCLLWSEGEDRLGPANLFLFVCFVALLAFYLFSFLGKSSLSSNQSDELISVK